MTELHTLASLANSQTLVLSKHILEHEMHPCVGDDVMLLSDIKQLEQTVHKMERELEKATQTSANLRTQESQTISTKEACSAKQ